MIKKYMNNRVKRHRRVRSKISGAAAQPRLAVFRSSEHIYAQLVDDVSGKTVGAASDLKIKDKMTKTDKAKQVGAEIAQIAKKSKITKIVFDRGGFAYHGRVKALAEGARAGGLKF